MVVIKEGSYAPDFKLEGSDGKMHTLSEFKDKTLVLYFYPKDDTAGCTIEAKGFNDMLADFKKAGAVVVGISKDGVDSHKKFCDKYSLKFLLLADPDLKTIKEYGAYGDKGIFGMGTLRTTFVIKNGKIMKMYQRVRALGHNEQVLAELKS